MAFATKPEMDIDVRRVTEVLDASSPGDVVTYAELSSLIGRNIQKTARGVLTKATRRQRRERSRVWEAIRNLGIKLASDGDLATNVPESARLKIQRLTKREAEKIAAIQNFEALSREQKTTVLAAQSMLGAIASFSKASTVRRIEAKVSEAGEQKVLSLVSVLDAFK